MRKDSTARCYGVLHAGVLALLCCWLAGCVGSPERDVDESRASVLVARGYIESGKLHRWPLCDGPPELMEVINCAPGRLSIVTFVIEEALVGSSASKRLRVNLAYTQSWPELARGRRHQYLAIIITDGSSHELEGAASLARTTEGRWAIPITLDQDSNLLPCTVYEVEPQPLQFLSPRPKESLAGLEYDQEDIDDLQSDGSYTVAGGDVYANKGVLLEHAPAAYAGDSAATVTGACRF
jgi:hypothetical protein